MGGGEREGAEENGKPFCRGAGSPSLVRRVLLALER